jgi:hypothetical protein
MQSAEYPFLLATPISSSIVIDDSFLLLKLSATRTDMESFTGRAGDLG